MPGRSASDADVEEAVARAALEVAAGRPLSGGRASPRPAWSTAPASGSASPPTCRGGTRRCATGSLQRIGAPVVLDNDANCAAHAELVAGALRGVSSALLVTVGTGIGGAVVLDGRVVRGANGMAGEFGHIQVVPDGLACECGLRGCWEQYCSGRALERVMRVALGSHLDGPEVADLARSGHPGARQAFATVGTWLGVGIAGLVSAFDPETVVVGGGVSAVGDLLLEPARRGLVDSLQATGYRELPPLVAARFGPEAGAVGAALLARTR